MTEETEKYVYGVVLLDTPLPKTKGIGGRKLGLVRGEDTAAIVSDVTPPVKTGKDELTTHARVLQRALEGGPVLPMQFGIVIPEEQLVREQLLDPFGEELVAQLHDLAGKVELHLRAVFEEEALMSEVVKANGKVLALSEALRDKPPDATYYDRIELGQEVAQTAETLILEERERILDVLTPLSAGARVNEAGHERVACNAAFLVEEEKLGEFDEVVNALGEANQDRLQFSYTGPHPAYNFVDLPLQV
ncbi:MAG TPA: GvpL/GvpF family gas vesicle protein [Solirubrobacteraceae bacterium]|jgi:hypothetical protein|nr:GvpL/GvpF family gas vesicle protein [Solirubrobacteraceae bacterium]